MNREVKFMMVAILCVAVLSLTVAYSALAATLKVSGTGTIKAGTWSVAFNGASATGTVGGSAVCPTATLSGSSASIEDIALKKPGDSCTYNLNIVNTGTIAATLTGITPTKPSVTLTGTSADAFQQYVKYTVTYNNKAVSDGISGLDTSLPASTGNIPVVLKIEFSNDATTVPSSELTITNLTTSFAYSAA